MRLPAKIWPRGLLRVSALSVLALRAGSCAHTRMLRQFTLDGLAVAVFRTPASAGIAPRVLFEQPKPCAKPDARTREDAPREAWSVSTLPECGWPTTCRDVT